MLAGKTLFITGASRGIGLAIALRAAQDGANVIIAAKTAEAHPKLPGTIYTAAADIEKAGGKALPCIVDIRYEDQVQKAVADAVSKFGGIDILVNNASAISLQGTEALPMKTYDLMHQINTRGTYLCCKICIPHLTKSSNPHILNISPPLSMKPRWFKDHVAYTMAKYGMSMCVLGMASELAPSGIAVNALWPRTAILTAAMKMLGGGDSIAEQCRTPEIMGDAAYAIFTKNSKTLSGQFLVDDDVLRKEGLSNKDLEKYSCVPGGKLMPDFFLDEFDTAMSQDAPSPSSTTAASSELDNAWDSLQSGIDDEAVGSVKGYVLFDIGDVSRKWLVNLKTSPGGVEELKGESSNKPDCVMTINSSDFVKLLAGKMNATSAFMTGKLKITGNMGIAMKLEKVFKKSVKAKL